MRVPPGAPPGASARMFIASGSIGIGPARPGEPLNRTFPKLRLPTDPRESTHAIKMGIPAKDGKRMLPGLSRNPNPESLRGFRFHSSEFFGDGLFDPGGLLMQMPERTEMLLPRLNDPCSMNPEPCLNGVLHENT